MGFFSSLFQAFTTQNAGWNGIRAAAIVALSKRADQIRVALQSPGSSKASHDDIEMGYRIALAGMLAPIEEFSDLLQQRDVNGKLLSPLCAHSDPGALIDTIGAMQGTLIRRSEAIYHEQWTELSVPESVRLQAKPYAAYFARSLDLSIETFSQNMFGFWYDPGPASWDPVQALSDSLFDASWKVFAEIRGHNAQDEETATKWAFLRGLVWSRFYDLCDMGPQFKSYFAVQLRQSIDLNGPG